MAAADGEPARLTLSGATLSSGYCGRRDPAVYGDNAFAAIFTREDLEIVVERSNLIALDKNSEAAGDPYVEDSLITGIYGFGANITLSGSGELYVRSPRGFCLAEDGGKHGGSLTLKDCSLTLYVEKGNDFGKSGSAGFIYAGGRFTGLSAQDSDMSLLSGVSFPEDVQENTAILLSAEADPGTALPGSPDMLEAQQPGNRLHYIRIQSADSLNDEPVILGTVVEDTEEVCVFVDKSLKGVTMQAVVAVYDKATGRLVDLWMGDIDPSEPLTGTGLTYDESKHYRIMVVDGDTWRPLGEHGDV